MVGGKWARNLRLTTTFQDLPLKKKRKLGCKWLQEKYDLFFVVFAATVAEIFILQE